ncbi:MAG: hypothetical protein ACI89L_002336 [Phycisphaerales bacterium]|jgi:hypothetical protein
MQTLAHPSRRSFKLALALAACLGLAGCNLTSHTEGGGQNSSDTFTYASTTYQPKTVTVIDTRDGEELWSVDVPVGQKLVVQFLEGRAKKSTPENPDVMKWGLGKESQRRLSLRNSMPVPPASARRLDMSLRATPEWPQANAGD